MSLKLFYKDKVFRYSVRFDDVTFAFLKNKILNKFPRLNWNASELYWTDSEGDHISIADDDAVEELKNNSDKVLKITVKVVETLEDVKCEKSTKSEKIKSEAPTVQSNSSSSKNGSPSRRNAVASIIENSTTVDDRGVSDKSETRSSCNLQNKNDETSSVSHKKPHKRSFLKCSVLLHQLEIGSLDNSSSSNAKKSKIVEESVVCENAAVRSENKFVNVDETSLSVVAKNSSLSSKRNSAKNKQLNAPKIQKVGNGTTIVIGNVSSGEKKSESLKGDKITSDKKCRLCGVVVNFDRYKRLHTEMFHLKNNGVDWLYQCVACGHRCVCLRQIDNHLRFSCSKGKVACVVKNKNYVLNDACGKRVAEICRSAFPSAKLSFFRKDDNRHIRCTVCNKSVDYGWRKCHVLQHVKEFADVTWLYKCLLCETFNTVYRHHARNHVREMHKVQSFQIGAEYTEIDSVGDIIYGVVAICFPDV